MPTAALFIILAVAVVLMYLMNKTSFTGKRGKKYSRQNEEKVSAEMIHDKWRGIEEMIITNRPSTLKAGVMEADKLLGAALSARGYSGDFVGKMRKAEKNFSNIDGVWTAHKFRNRMVHEVGHDFFTSEAKSAIAEYKRALKDLRVL